MPTKTAPWIIRAFLIKICAAGTERTRFAREGGVNYITIARSGAIGQLGRHWRNEFAPQPVRALNGPFFILICTLFLVAVCPFH